MGISMSERVLLYNDGRRSPRFSCTGRSSVYCLPLEGTSLAGRLRNLSLGGVCLNLCESLEAGERTELVLAVNAESFRAAALVKGSPLCGTRLQFTHMSAFGRDVLADLLARMAEERALHDRLKSSRIDNETARMLMAQERSGFAAGRSGAMVTVARDSAALNSEPSRIVEADPILIRVDVYV